MELIKPIEGKAKGVTFTIWDVGGEEKIRPLWRSYIRHTDAIVFVIDSVDQERFEEAKLELTNLLRCPDIRSTVPIVVLSNKQDLPGSRNEREVTASLGLTDAHSSHNFQFIECCAVTGEGLENFFDLLYTAILNCQKQQKTKRRNKR
ncbi:unnamed protein product [Soboliphyme baturini]|uniref:ADP-ribosylation factor-like protein 4C n=1 Tax=Soboliphyme baturini TaxID=241478 RepID=A0A183IQH1_9BILA|nr:unnamed protein product [Soboliphyme baturini]